MSAEPEIVYNLAHLEKWPKDVPHWPSDGVALAVVGHPIAHSLSPVMHNAALAELAKTDTQFAKWRYFKFDIAPEELGKAIHLFYKKNFLGLNLTVPHKILVLEHVSSEVPTVKDAGAANTLTRTETWWKGYNTDGDGLRRALEDRSIQIQGADVILLGAGGAARSAALECLLHGCASLRIQNRTQSTAHTLISHLKQSMSSNGRIEVIPFDPKDRALPADAIVINATSLGLKPDDASPLDLNTIPRPKFVFDMIYRPPQTALLRQAFELGIEKANGLSMLVHQGAEALEIWTGQTAPVSVMSAAAQAGLAAH